MLPSPALLSPAPISCRREHQQDAMVLAQTPRARIDGESGRFTRRESPGSGARRYTAPAARSTACSVGDMNAPTIHRTGKMNPIQNIQ